MRGCTRQPAQARRLRHLDHGAVARHREGQFDQLASRAGHHRRPAADRLHALLYLANCSILFTESAARAARCSCSSRLLTPSSSVPFPTATLSDREIDRFVAAIEEAGVRLAAGDPAPEADLARRRILSAR